MGHSFHQLYYHFVWGTQDRLPLIGRTWRPKLLTVINEQAKKRDGIPLRHNAMPDHVHLLVRLPPTVLVSDFIGKVKGATSFYVNRDVRPEFKLKWQEGYGVLSLRKDEVEKVARYIDDQETHHRSRRLSVLMERLESDDDEPWPEIPGLKAP